jgi:hypothetical protein
MARRAVSPRHGFSYNQPVRSQRERVGCGLVSPRLGPCVPGPCNRGSAAFMPVGRDAMGGMMGASQPMHAWTFLWVRLSGKR